MRALTLQQPHATCISDGPKRIENRPRSPFARHAQLPEWVALHAGRTFYPGATFDAIRSLWPECPSFDAMPLGAILALMRVDRVDEFPRGRLVQSSYERVIGEDPWAFGPICLTIGAVVPLPEPIPCRGMLGLWRVPPEVEARIPADVRARTT